MEKKIKLKSRGGLNNYLVQIDDSNPLMYKLDTQFSFRIGYSENNDDLSFIDPAGGPFMTVGCEINGHKIKSIHKGCIIEFES